MLYLCCEVSFETVSHCLAFAIKKEIFVNFFLVFRDPRNNNLIYFFIETKAMGKYTSWSVKDE